MKNFRRTQNCSNCLHCTSYDEVEVIKVGEQLYQEWYTYYCKRPQGEDIKAPAIYVCDDWEEK